MIVLFFGGLAHPDSYREARACEIFDCSFIGGLAHPDSYREARACEIFDCSFIGGLAQLARACDWQSQGQGFDSPNLHKLPGQSPGFTK